jgi:hypothetical protein
MGLDLIRRISRPGARTAPATFLSVVLMVAVALGLVAMHDSGVEHAAHAGASAAAQESHRAEHAGEPAATAAATAAATMVASATTFVVGCDAGCMEGLLDCAAVAMACAMMIAFAVVLALAARPAMFRQLRDGGGPGIAAVRDRVAVHLRPDLHVLSISRT